MCQKRFLLSQILILLVINALCQVWIGKEPLRMPEKCKKPRFSIDYRNLDSDTRSNFIWYVWADRENIITTSGKRLEFLQKFLVVEENQNKIHIVEDNGNYNVTLGEFQSEPIDFGWVDKHYMLLWPAALYSDSRGFRIKVMTITTPDIIKENFENIRSEARKLSFYNSPVTTRMNGIKSPLFEVFYILKSEGNRFLLSKKDNISRGIASDYILGWADKKSVQLWDQRQALEPNWDIAAAKQRVNRKIPASVFGREKEAVDYSRGMSLDKAIWNSDSYSVRKSPYWRRFPIFEKNNNQFKTAVISDMINATGKSIPEDFKVRIDSLISEHEKNRRNVNVVFVVDGTRSMGPYMKSVRKGVQNSVSQIRDSENKYKFGAVIYRDYDDPDDKNDKCFLILPLTIDLGIFSSFFARVDTQDPECINNTDSEGLYHGLYKACRSVLRGKENETNIIILIGDAGDRNEPGRTNEKDVLPLITRYNVNILALQVHHNQPSAYEDFIYQVTDLVRNAASEMVRNQAEKYSGIGLRGLGEQPRWRQSSVGNRQQFYLRHSPITGGLQYTNVGQLISSKTVEIEVEKLILETNKTNNNLLKQIRSIKSASLGDTEGAFTPEIIAFLERAGLSPEQIDIMTRENYQFLMEAHTVYKVNLLNFPVYNYIVFLDQDELNELLVVLDKLVDCPQCTYNQRREQLQKAWYEILKANYGVKNREQLENKTMSELLELVTGLPSPNPLNRDIRFNDIADRTRLPDNRLDELIYSIRQKRNLLAKITGNKQYYFISNDRAFYWIPQTSLP